MKNKSGFVFSIVTLIFCGCPGMLICLGGFVIANLGLMAAKAQLKVDTNLDQSSVISTGLGGVCLGFLLIVIPVLSWLWSNRR